MNGVGSLSQYFAYSRAKELTTIALDASPRAADGKAANLLASASGSRPCPVVKCGDMHQWSTLTDSARAPGGKNLQIVDLIVGSLEWTSP
jgi:hypothetical protein